MDMDNFILSIISIDNLRNKDLEGTGPKEGGGVILPHTVDGENSKFQWNVYPCIEEKMFPPRDIE